MTASVPDEYRADQVRLGPQAAARCRRRIHLDARPDVAAPAFGPAAEQARQLMIDDLVAHREWVLARIRRDYPYSILDALGPLDARDREGPEATESSEGLTAAQSPHLVFHPALHSVTRTGGPDLLVWAGDGYLPVIIRAHRTLDAGEGAQLAPLSEPLTVTVDPARRPRGQRADLLALAHAYRLLEDLGLAASTARGGVIGRGGTDLSVDGRVDGRADSADPGADAGVDLTGDRGDASVVVWHDLDLPEFDRRFADRIAVATAAATGRPALAGPSRVAECLRCPWWQVCGPQLRARQDISLVLSGPDVVAAHKAGLRTVPELAALPAAVAATVPFVTMPAETARIRARAWLSDAPLARLSRDSSVPRADVELDVDTESFFEDGAYLWGTFLSGADIGLAQGYLPFVTWRPLPSAAEGEVFAAFWAYLEAVRAAAAARSLTFAAYCYSRTAEERWMRGLPVRRPATPGMPTLDVVERFCASPEWVDLLEELRRSFLLPGPMGLKAVAQIAGFAWRDAEPGGANSMAWYRTAIGPAGNGDGRPADAALAERVLRYNEDDVRATLAVRRWLTEHAPELPTVDELAAD